MRRLGFQRGVAGLCALLALALSACGGGEETVTVTQTVAAESGNGDGKDGGKNEPEIATEQGAVTGYVDNVAVEGDVMILSGWAASSDLSQPATQVTAEVEGETVVEAVPAIEREDVVEALGEPGLADSGFELRLPVESLECDSPGAGIKVTGSLEGESSALLFGEGIKGRISSEC